MYYRKDEDQLSIEEFFMPFGGKLSRDNRWVCLAGTMPWKQIDDIYAQNMRGKLGVRVSRRESHSNPYTSKGIAITWTKKQ